MNKGAVLPLTPSNAACWNPGGKARWAWGACPDGRMDGRTDGRNARVKRIPGAVTHKQQLRTWPSLRGWLSSESLPQRPKCHWAEQPPEKLLGGGTDSPIGHHTPLHPWRGEKITKSQSWNGCQQRSSDERPPSAAKPLCNAGWWLLHPYLGIASDWPSHVIFEQLY